MRIIHPAAIIGILLNFGLAWMLFTALGSFDISMLRPEDQETMTAIIEAVYAIRPVYYGLLVLQVIGLALIVLRVRFGLGLAGVAAFFMLPGSLIYIIGCALTYNRVRYENFPPAPKDPYSGAFFVYPSAWAPKARIATGVSMLVSLGALLLGYSDVALIMFGMSLAAFYCALRAARHHALALLRDTFVLVPALFAPRIALAYRDVRGAELFDDRILFAVETPDGAAALAWSLRNLEPRERDKAIEELGAALAAHNVPLR